MEDIDAEIGRIVYLQNRGLEHFPDHIPYTRNAIESMIMPLLDVIDTDLVLFAEADEQPASEVLPQVFEMIHLFHQNHQPECLVVKSIVVPPEYRDTGIAGNCSKW